VKAESRIEVEDLEGEVRELRRTSATLEASRDRYLDLYVNAPVAYVTFDLTGAIRQVNHAAVALFGISARKLLESPFTSLLEPEARDAFAAHLRELSENPAGASVDLAFSVRAPERLVVQMVSSVAADDPMEVMALLFDVSERRQGERVLQILDRAAGFFAPIATPATILDQLANLAVPLLADACVAELFDESGGVMHRATAMAPRIAGHARFPPDVLTASMGVRSAVVKAILTGEPQVVDHLRLESLPGMGPEPAAAQGHLEIRSLVALPLAGRGQVFGVLVLLTVGHASRFHPADVKLAVELARRASLAIDNGRMFLELHEAQAAKDRFLAMLSHELRTPLNPALAAVSGLLEADVPLPPQLERTLRIIHENLNLEARFVDDLSDLVRAARGEFELLLSPVDLHAVLLDVLSVCEEDLRKQSIVLTVNLEAGRFVVHGDAARLKQILWNLVRNAVKFTPPGGSVSVTTRNSGERICVEIVDSGIGIEQKYLSKIFDPFTQADDSIGSRFGGMGLGLAICRTLTRAHRGKLSVESEGLGKGAKFTFAIPLHGGEPSSVPDSVPSFASGIWPAGRGSKLSVLVVDDDQDTREVMAALLGRFGCVVSTAPTVAAALDAARTTSFDVLISDIHLPDGTGLQLLGKLRLRKCGVRGIAVSGAVSPEDVDRAKAAGFVTYLKKPITFGQLRAALADLA
jgi:PAS domain S-box-containing protein